MNKDSEFITLWEFRVSQRAAINISRMIDPQKEKDFFLNEEYLKKLETKEQFAKESKERIKIKKDKEKFYLNSVIEGFDKNKFRTKGFSIFRHQIPQLVETLQNIYDGDYDSWLNKKLIELGIVKKIPQNDDETQTDDLEIKKKSEKYSIWIETLSEKLKKEVKELQNKGWTSDEIQLAFKARYS